jgi:two-component system nitrate/nitrite response regulator NarL
MSGSLQFLTNQAPSNLTPLPDHSPESHEVARVPTILIVDDSHFERNAIRGAVEGLTKFRVCGEAANGVEGIKKARELRPDLIVMDLAMPLMNGVEAAMVLRHTLPNVPVVLLTLYAEQLRGAISPGFGVTVVLSKADGLAPLLGCLQRMLAAD